MKRPALLLAAIMLIAQPAAAQWITVDHLGMSNGRVYVTISSGDPLVLVRGVTISGLPERWDHYGYGPFAYTATFDCGVGNFPEPECEDDAIEVGPGRWRMPDFGWSFGYGYDQIGFSHASGMSFVQFVMIDYLPRYRDIDDWDTWSGEVVWDLVSLQEPPTVTPEPLSLLLLGTGLAGVGAARRRRQRHYQSG
jgi:hypothetical protein